jgi:hypothetical protein
MSDRSEPGDAMATFGHRVFRSYREHAEMLYLKAIKAGNPQPVILMDARDQEGRRARAEAKQDLPEHLPVVHAGIMVGSRAQIAREVAKVIGKDAEEIADGYNPLRPFTVVVITEDGPLRVEVFDEPAPG